MVESHDSTKSEKTPEVPDIAEAAGANYGEWFFNYSKIFGRRCVEWFIVYMFGYYNASFGWLMAPLFFLVLRDKRAKEKKVKFDIARSIANADEKEILLEIQKFSSLPSWVKFPDMERVEWINKILRQLWPYAGQYVRDLCKHSIEPAIAEALTAYKLNGFQFDKMILGDTAPRISGIKVYDDTSRHEIIMDMDVIYAGDCKFEVSVSKISAGIKDLQFLGTEEFISILRMYIEAGRQINYLVQDVILNVTLSTLTTLLDESNFLEILRNIVIDVIGSMMVLPNRFPIQLVEDINVVELKCPQPAGVIRIHVIEAKNLMKKDFGIMGKSDPYCILHLGAQKYQTKTINNTVNPTWDYCCEFQVMVKRGQEINFEILDTDDGPGQDDLLGRANLDVHEIWKSGEIDTWVPLSDAKHGRLHIRATWLDLTEESNTLDLQLEEIRQLQNMTKNPLHSAILMVWCDSASKLNNTNKSIHVIYVRIHIKNYVHDSRLIFTKDPAHKKGGNFVFLLNNYRCHDEDKEVEKFLTAKSINQQNKMQLNDLFDKPDFPVKGNVHPIIDTLARKSILESGMSDTLKMLQLSLKVRHGRVGP
ncbi:unnamed protein product, partial [Meganyctiphanes norvegica]